MIFTVTAVGVLLEAWGPATDNARQGFSGLLASQRTLVSKLLGLPVITHPWSRLHAD